MNRHIAFALGHPVFEPETEIVPGHFWWIDRQCSAGLTANIGLE